MAVDARSLFDFCTRLQSQDGPQVLPLGDRVEVSGRVMRAALGYDHTPLVFLEADSVGTCHVECRCLSEEVLQRAGIGSLVVVTGFCQGLEDGVTAVVDRCELLAVNGHRTPGRRAAISRAPSSDLRPPRCTFCGRTRAEVHRLLTIGEKSICNRCVSDYSRRLAESGGAQEVGPRPGVALRSAHTAGRPERWAMRLLRWLRRRKNFAPSSVPK